MKDVMKMAMRELIKGTAVTALGGAYIPSAELVLGQEQKKDKEEEENLYYEFLYENSLQLHKDFPELYPHPGPRPY
jgi:hypothetical protein